MLQLLSYDSFASRVWRVLKFFPGLAVSLNIASSRAMNTLFCQTDPGKKSIPDF